MRLLDLHALCAAAGLGLVLGTEHRWSAWLLWTAFLVAPLLLFAVKRRLFKQLNGRLPEKDGRDRRGESRREFPPT